MRSTFLSTRHSQLVGVLAIALFIAGAGVAVVAQTASGAVTTLATFTTPGTYLWTVPTGVTNVTFDVFGARGGGVVSIGPGGIVNPISQGGPGGEAKGKFAVHGGEKFEIVVGGQGSTEAEGVSAGTAGFNGGGAGDLIEGGGGGGSDVRIGGRGNPCVSSKSCAYSDRIIVGGGGEAVRTSLAILVIPAAASPAAAVPAIPAARVVPRTAAWQPSIVSRAASAISASVARPAAPAGVRAVAAGTAAAAF